jgi:hypothetical protein
VCSLTNNSIGDEGGKSIAAVLPQSKITSLWCVAAFTTSPELLCRLHGIVHCI